MINILNILSRTYKGDETIKYISTQINDNLVAIIDHVTYCSVIIPKYTIFNTNIETNSDILIACLSIILKSDDIEINISKFYDSEEDVILLYLYMQLLYIKFYNKITHKDLLKIKYIKEELDLTTLSQSSLLDNFKDLNYYKIIYIINVIKYY